jgi:hypothetical protein
MLGTADEGALSVEEETDCTDVGSKGEIAVTDPVSASKGGSRGCKAESTL